jgi:hypothetical protein
MKAMKLTGLRKVFELQHKIWRLASQRRCAEEVLEPVHRSGLTCPPRQLLQRRGEFEHTIAITDDIKIVAKPGENRGKHLTHLAVK